MVPVLGNKGAGKTHLLHSIKHGGGGQWQLLVTPGVYQKDTDFLEYLLFQIIDTLLGGGKQKGVRPLEYVGEQLVRRLLGVALSRTDAGREGGTVPAAGPGPLGAAARPRHARRRRSAPSGSPRTSSGYSNFGRVPTPLPQALAEAGLDAAEGVRAASCALRRARPRRTTPPA